MRSRYLPPLVAIVICAIMIGFNAARASSFADDTAPPQETANPEVAITPLLQYQGRMTNPTTGQPVADGVYAVTFSLYDVASGGTAKWTETKNVPVAGGLFSTALGDTTPLPQSLFSGQALWLGIKVGSDLEATPRQAIVPVAYALSLVPGAAITGSLTSPALRVSNTGGQALVTSGSTTLGGNVTINGSLTGGTHAHDGSAITSGTIPEPRIDPLIARDAEVAASYYNKTETDNRFVNVSGPESMSGSSTLPILAVTQNGSGNGLRGDSFAGYGGYFTGGQGAIYAGGSVTVTGDLILSGNLKAPRIRYVPITAGDLMHSMGDTVLAGDCCNGVIFPDGSQSGGSITFPLPDDYVPGTNLSLDLYLIPLDSGSGSIMFWVRFVGLTTGGWSGTGSSVINGSIPLGTPNNLHKQSFTLPGFTAGSLPELAELTIRREPSDTYAGRVTLIGLRLAYQASR